MKSGSSKDAHDIWSFFMDQLQHFLLLEKGYLTKWRRRYSFLYLLYLPLCILDPKINVHKKQQLSTKCIMVIYKIEKNVVRANEETKDRHHQNINTGDSWICHWISTKATL
jgi:hypothetical protein